MASTPGFVQFVAEQCSDAGHITARKMFGEYGIYCNGKIFGVICDDRLFFKVTEAGRALVPHAPLLPPYEGAKPYLLAEDLDDRALLADLVRVTLENC